MARPDHNTLQIKGFLPLILLGALMVGLITLIAVGLPQLSLAQNTGSAKKPTTSASNTKNSPTQSGTGAQDSLNNGPQVQPKANIQSTPTIQQRVPIQPRI